MKDKQRGLKIGERMKGNKKRKKKNEGRLEIRKEEKLKIHIDREMTNAICMSKRKAKCTCDWLPSRAAA